MCSKKTTIFLLSGMLTRMYVTMVLYWYCKAGGGMSVFLEALGDLDAEGDLPLYLRLQRAIRQAVTDGRVAPEDALPPERSLAEVLKVSRITVRKAIDGLVAEGLLVRRQGAGTFVSGRVEKSFSRLTSFSEDMIARGRAPRSVWLKKEHGAVTPQEALSLGLSPGTPVFRFHRLRFADDLPMAVEYSTVPEFSLPAIDAVAASLYDALARTGHRPTRALQRLRAIPFRTVEAELLHIPVGSAGLLIERRGFMRDGRPVEITQSYYRGDAYDFVAEINEAG